MSRPDHSRPTPTGSVPQPSDGTRQLSPTGGFALFKRRHDRKGVMMNRVWIAGAAVIAAVGAFSLTQARPESAKAAGGQGAGGEGSPRAPETPPQAGDPSAARRLGAGVFPPS